MKYLNNVIEADRGKLKLLIRPVRGFKTLKTAYATIKGFEVMHAQRKDQVLYFCLFRSGYAAFLRTDSSGKTDLFVTLHAGLFFPSSCHSDILGRHRRPEYGRNARNFFFRCTAQFENSR